VLQEFVSHQASGGIVLMAVTVLALWAANSSLSLGYFGALEFHVAGLSILHWVNDALMAVFFLLVGLEIKREMVLGAERVNDFAAPGDINLVCGAVVCAD